MEDGALPPDPKNPGRRFHILSQRAMSFVFRPSGLVLTLALARSVLALPNTTDQDASSRHLRLHPLLGQMLSASSAEVSDVARVVAARVPAPLRSPWAFLGRFGESSPSSARRDAPFVEDPPTPSQRVVYGIFAAVYVVAAIYFLRRGSRFVRELAQLRGARTFHVLCSLAVLAVATGNALMAASQPCVAFLPWLYCGRLVGASLWVSALGLASGAKPVDVAAAATLTGAAVEQLGAATGLERSALPFGLFISGLCCGLSASWLAMSMCRNSRLGTLVQEGMRPVVDLARVCGAAYCVLAPWGIQLSTGMAGIVCFGFTDVALFVGGGHLLLKLVELNNLTGNEKQAASWRLMNTKHERRSDSELKQLVRQWDVKVQPRARELYRDPDMLRETLTRVARGISRGTDPVLGPADRCVRWHGEAPQIATGSQPVVRVARPDADESAMYVNRLLAFLFTDDSDFEHLVKLSKEQPFRMKCGHCQCVNVNHVSRTG